MLTRALKRLGADLHERVLGPRQRIRIGDAFASAADEIKRRLDQGDIPSVGWTEARDGHRPEAEEVLEGVLLAASDAWEERRVRHIGLLYAELSFLQFRPEYAHYIVTVAGRLTSRQMLCLSVLLCEDLGTFKLFEQADVTVLENGLEAELDELGQSGLLGFLQADGGSSSASKHSRCRSNVGYADLVGCPHKCWSNARPRHAPREHLRDGAAGYPGLA
jgi:hypothetical protein